MMPSRLLLFANQIASRRLCRRGSISCRVDGAMLPAAPCSRFKPQSEQKKTASMERRCQHRVTCLRPRQHSQFGCFQFKAVHTVGLKLEKRIFRQVVRMSLILMRTI